MEKDPLDEGPVEGDFSCLVYAQPTLAQCVCMQEQPARKKKQDGSHLAEKNPQRGREKPCGQQQIYPNAPETVSFLVPAFHGKFLMYFIPQGDFGIKKNLACIFMTHVHQRPASGDNYYCGHMWRCNWDRTRLCTPAPRHL